MRSREALSRSMTRSSGWRSNLSHWRTETERRAFNGASPLRAVMAFKSSQIALVAPVPVHEHVRDIGDNWVSANRPCGSRGTDAAPSADSRAATGLTAVVATRWRAAGGASLCNARCNDKTSPACAHLAPRTFASRSRQHLGVKRCLVPLQKPDRGANVAEPVDAMAVHGF